MTWDIWKEREHAFEEHWAHSKDEELIAKMRNHAHLESIAKSLAEKLAVDDPELLRAVADLGVTLDTGAALLLAPLVQIAWAEGEVTDAERAAVLRYAEGRGLEKSSPAYAQLVGWLDQRPSDALFDVAVEVLQRGLSLLPQAERDERIAAFAKACHEVAEASGGGLARLLGLHKSVSMQEHAIHDRIKAHLREPA
jgi:hypothetical protein